MSRRGENIYKRKDGRWEGRYISSYDFNGKAKYSSVYARSYIEVKERLKSQSTKSISNNKSDGNKTIEQISKEWLENIKIRLKESSYAKYYNLLHNHIIPYLGNIKIKMLTSETVNEFTKYKLENGRLDKSGGLSGKTVLDILSMLIQIIQYAEKKKYIENFEYDFIHPKTQSSELTILSTAEQNRLVKYIQLNPDIQKTGVLVALYTGIRLGELCALKWQDIDFDTGNLKITKTLQRIKNTEIPVLAKTKIIIDVPKSYKSIRNIPIPSFLLEILKAYRKKHSPDCYILSGTLKYIEPRVYQSKFKKYLKATGIEDVKFHTLRHTFATRAIERGFDIKSLSEILGHSTVRFTLDRYVHGSYELKRICMEKLPSCF